LEKKVAAKRPFSTQGGDKVGPDEGGGWWEKPTLVGKNERRKKVKRL